MNLKAKQYIRNILLGFVLVSIGFIAGKELTRSRLQRNSSTGLQAKDVKGDKVIAYYMHKTVRCVTCNKIEELAHMVVQEKFADQLKAGRLVWKVVNIDDRDDLAKKYNIGGSSLVIVKFHNGKVSGFKSLEDVWTLVHDEPEFTSYVEGAIRKYLGKEAS